MAEFFSTAESLAEADAAFPAEQQVGQLGLIQKRIRVWFQLPAPRCSVQSFGCEEEENKSKKVQKAHGGESKKVHRAVGSKAAKGRKGPSTREEQSEALRQFEEGRNVTLSSLCTRLDGQ